MASDGESSNASGRRICEKPEAFCVSGSDLLSEASTSSAFMDDQDTADSSDCESRSSSELHRNPLADHYQGVIIKGRNQIMTSSTSSGDENHTAGDPSEDLFQRFAAMENGSWTDDMHCSYLNFMEEEFVKNLYRREYCALDVCGRSPVSLIMARRNPETATNAIINRPSFAKRKTSCIKLEGRRRRFHLRQSTRKGRSENRQFVETLPMEVDLKLRLGTCSSGWKLFTTSKEADDEEEMMMMKRSLIRQEEEGPPKWFSPPPPFVTRCKKVPKKST